MVIVVILTRKDLCGDYSLTKMGKRKDSTVNSLYTTLSTEGPVEMYRWKYVLVNQLISDRKSSSKH